LRESEVLQAKEKYNHLFQRASRLQQMDAVITIRQICYALEWRICLQAAGSKTLEEVMASLNLRKGTIEKLKKNGDVVVHDNRSILKTSEIREILAQDESDEIDKQQHDAFIAALYELEMVLEDGTVDATKA
jgi:hypothetical protein